MHKRLALPLMLIALLTSAVAAPAMTRASHCIAIASTLPEAQFIPAQLVPGETGLEWDEVRIEFVSHATFLITTAQGYRIATDYTGYAGNGVIPDVVTMNRAHSSHYTDFPDPRIPHVLRGWVNAEGTGPASHRVELTDETLIRNVPTDIRSFQGRVPGGNSIFIFEAAGLCIGHLGHIHHEPSEEQYALIGRLDVVMVPVDGGLTVDIPTLRRITERLRSSIVLPMHWFGGASLSQFVDGLSDRYTPVRVPSGEITVSLRTLPRSPEIRILGGIAIPGMGVLP